MRPSRLDIVVRVTDAGQVHVNGQLVAEHALDEVNGRDDLARELKLHRIADVVLEQLNSVCRAAGAIPDKRRDAVGRGLLDGLSGLTEEHPLPGVPPTNPMSPTEGEKYPAGRDYDEGYRAGESLRALRGHLAAASTDNGQDAA